MIIIKLTNYILMFENIFTDNWHKFVNFADNGRYLYIFRFVSANVSIVISILLHLLLC